MKCRHCQTELTLPFLDLGSAPPSNAYLTLQQLYAPERWYPLKVLVCTECWLVQTEDYAQADELFDANYAYFSSFSATWLKHAEIYVGDMANRYELGSASMVIEVAANDGYLLQYVKARGIPCLGIEPTASTAAAAQNKGITIVRDFFGVRLAQELAAQGKRADLMVANNVLAHVPDINDFLNGFALLLKSGGVATFEFPHLLRLVEGLQFDTIYHEHYSYLSLTALDGIFRHNGLHIFDAEELPTHGGSLRVYAQPAASIKLPINKRLKHLLALERQAGMGTPEFYQGFQCQAERIKLAFLAFLIASRRSGWKLAAYGAAAKGNTLLNYSGLRSDLLPYVVDRNPAKQGKFMPGSRIPIVGEERLHLDRPDYVVVLPWNLRDEIVAQLDYVRGWGGQFVVTTPELKMYP